jgi:hypothetical protein
MITVNEWITSSNNYPERANSPELNDEIKSNAQVLCDKVNAFLIDLGWKELVRLTSGFRPTDVNENTPNAAQHSGHEIGKALDIWDDYDQNLCKLVMSRPDLLRKHGLMMESMLSTKGKNTNWCHLDYIDRPDRASRTFIP